MTIELSKWYHCATYIRATTYQKKSDAQLINRGCTVTLKYLVAIWVNLWRHIEIEASPLINSTMQGACHYNSKTWLFNK